MGYFDADEKEMLEVYMLETRQLLEQLDGFLLEAEKKHSFTESEIHAVFRIMHTIKGSSAMMRLSDLSRTAHKLEDLFSYYRENWGRIDDPEPELFDLLFAASDYIANELDDMAQESYQPRTAATVEERAEAFLKTARDKKTESRQIAENPAEDQENQKELEEKEENPLDLSEMFKGKDGMIVRVNLERGCKMENIRAFMLVRQIEEKCTSVETYPDHLDKAHAQAGYISQHGVIIRFESQEKQTVLEMLGKGLFVESCEVLEDRTVKRAEPEKAAEEKPADEKKESDFLSVRTDRLDVLQTLSGEMIVQMLTLDNALAQAGQEELREGAAYQLSRMINDVERIVMEMRMVPVSTLIPKLRRVFRDICRVQKKDVEFVANCGDIEADKSVVEYVFEALMHIIRNAVDHGIETPEERAASGKEKVGKITFMSQSTVGELILSIQDDGRGINPKKILASAKEKGILDKREEEYEVHEIWNLILHPGFTTKETVTEFSGRGVGLDVVKNIMEEAGGHLYIESEEGKGSKFTIVLPLTLSTIECARFSVEGCRFSVPARYVCGFYEYRKEKKNIQMLNDRAYIMMSGKMMPLIDLRRFYRLQGNTGEAALMIHLKNNDREACLIADAMFVQKRIVVKPLPAVFGPGFRRNTGICGLSMMGSGKICSALDAEILISLYESEGEYKNGN